MRFPVTVTSTFSKTTQVTSRARSGEIIRIALRTLGQDVFTANGKRLAGLPYRFNTRLLDEDGVLVHGCASGVVMRIPLPDGSVFRTAGRVGVVARGADFIVVPDTRDPRRRAGALRRAQLIAPAACPGPARGTAAPRGAPAVLDPAEHEAVDALEP